MMFRRRDEEENEYTLQPTSKNNSGSGFGAAAPQPAAPSFGASSGNNNSNNNALNDEAQQTPVPFIKSSSVSAPQEVQPKAAEAPKEAKPAAVNPKPAATNTFVPSALRATASNTPAAPASSTPSSVSQLPSFGSKTGTGMKIENINLETERRLTVGYGISLEGKVSDCDKLVIYGNVNAELNNVKALQISDSGCFRGAAEIDFAEISGVFEGELKVRKSIVINSTGRVSGKITYGSIEIKPGGKFTGEIVEDKALTEEAAKQDEDSAAPAGLTEEAFNLFNESKTEKAA